MIPAVVHDGVLKHDQDVAMELLRGACRAVLNVLLDARQVDGTMHDALVAGRDLVGDGMEEYVGVSVQSERIGIRSNLVIPIHFKQIQARKICLHIKGSKAKT